MSAPQSLDDMVAMAMARQALRPLVPDAPPTPSPALAGMLADGMSVRGRRRSSVLARLAGAGLAGKVLLVAGVAVAGGAATAVAFTKDQPPPVEHLDVTGRPPAPAPASARPAHAPAVAPTQTVAPRVEAPEHPLESSSPQPVGVHETHESETRHQSDGGSDGEHGTQTASPTPTASSTSSGDGSHDGGSDSPDPSSSDGGSGGDSGTSSDH